MQNQAKDKQRKSASYVFGCEAEKLVMEHLIRNGLTILYNRWKNPYGEIDIIATHHNLLVFVEVKARKLFNDQEVVSVRQQHKSSEAALYFLSQNEQYAACNIRFDCALIFKDMSLEYIKNAWYIGL